jgi:1-acyl-sn-glycerol-3-phosphate acyltransferase
LLACAFAGWKATGIEKLDPAGTYVLVANHASFLDIPVILSALPVEVRFFAKKSLFTVPFIGWYLSRGHLAVERGDARASLKSMLEGAKIIKERRVSVLLFPEGGRQANGMRPFIEGAAYIAIKAGVPIVPIGLVNTKGVLPMHSLLLRPGKIEIHVGDPIRTAGMTPRDRGQLNETLYRQVAELAGEPVASAA